MKGSNYNKMIALLIIAVFAVPMTAAVSSHGSSGDNTFVSYYDQLDANGKAIYDQVNSATPDETVIDVTLPVILTAQADNPDDAKEYVVDLAKATINNAFAALTLSSPLAFWTWEVSVVPMPDIEPMITGNTATLSTIHFTNNLSYLPTDPATGEPQSIQKMLDDINAAIDKFSTSSDTVRGKVLDINNYLVNLITYDPNWGGDNASKFGHDVYGAFVDPNHYAVCDGYSKAFLILCEKEGINSVVVKGTALPSLVSHAWNYVQMENGNWYAIDVTWNDDGSGSNPYFLVGGSTFFTTHQQGVFLDTGLLAYNLNSPVVSATPYDNETAPNYDIYSWLLAAIVVIAIAVALIRYARRGG